jgi:hypothetical protein
MRDYVKYLTDKLETLNEEIDEDAMPLSFNTMIASKDTQKPGKHSIAINDTNTYKENDPDFEDGFMVEHGADGNIRILHRINLSSLMRVAKIPEDKLRAKVLEFIENTPYRLDIRTGEEGDDNRGYYKVRNVVNDYLEEKEGTTYLTVELLLDKESPIMGKDTGEKRGRKSAAEIEAEKEMKQDNPTQEF